MNLINPSLENKVKELSELRKTKPLFGLDCNVILNVIRQSLLKARLNISLNLYQT